MNFPSEYVINICKGKCKPTVLYRSLCKCVMDEINAIMQKLAEFHNRPIHSESEEFSFHEYATHSLGLESISLDDPDNLSIMKNASRFAQKFNLRTFNLKNLLSIHKELLKNHPDIAGIIRQSPMFLPIPGRNSFSRKPDPNQLQDELRNFFEWFGAESSSDDTNPIIFAAISKLILVRIHPFADGNGRTSRLLFNIILQKRLGLPFWVTVPQEEILEY